MRRDKMSGTDMGETIGVKSHPHILFGCVEHISRKLVEHRIHFSRTLLLARGARAEQRCALVEDQYELARLSRGPLQSPRSQMRAAQGAETPRMWLRHILGGRVWESNPPRVAGNPYQI